MAEVVLTVVVRVLRESLQLHGARGLDLDRAASGDTPSYQVPELPLNICIVSELFVQILASGLGTLSLVWATVVLLGGFSVSLQAADFWVITVIVFIQTAKIMGLNLNPEAQFFNQVPPAFLELGAEHFTTWGRKGPLTGQATGRNLWYYIMLGLGSAWDLISMMALLTLFILVLPQLAVLTCIALSIFRLVVLTSHHQSWGNSADPSKANVLRSLIIFYALVLAQGGLFILWWCLMICRLVLADRVSKEYQFGNDKRKLIDKYIDRTLSTSIKKGVLSTINSNLVSFAADLIKSEYSQDRMYAVLVLHTLTSQDAHKERALSQIQSSPECIASLLDMVGPKSRIDQKNKISIAQIVADLASNLRLADISRATDSITSLIDPYLTKISTRAINVNNDQQSVTIDISNGQQGTSQTPTTTIEEESKPLIIHGLLILAKLAGNPDNCTEIYNTMGLFSKIIAPISSKVYNIISDDATTVEITEKSLQVVSMLASGTHQTNKMIRQKICENGLAVKIRSILTDDRTNDPRYNKLKVPATKILTNLALDRFIGYTDGLGTMVDFINVLTGLFFNGDDESGLRKKAGKALAMLAMDSETNCMTIMESRTPTDHSVVQRLTDMLQDANNVLYRTAVAQMLMQFCANSSADREAERLQSVKTILHEVLRVICLVDREANINQSDSPQNNQTPAQRVLQFLCPCIDSSSFANRRNQTPAQSALQFLFPCIDSSSFANIRNQDTTRGEPGRNQGLARTQPANSNILPNRTLSQWVLLYFNNMVNAARRNRNIHGDNCQNQPPPAQIGRGRIKTLAAFLGLANQICDKLMINANDFGTALDRIPLPRDMFVEKLMEIIEMCKGHSVDILEEKGRSADYYLVIIKAVTKLCTWVMRNNPEYIEDFRNKNIAEKLQDALEDMIELERAILLTGSADDMTNYKTLSSIVQDAKSCILSQQPNV